MEKLLKVDPSGVSRIRETLRYNFSERLKPLFSFIGEQEAITPLDAAALLEKEPYANVQHKLDKQAERFDAMKGSKFNFSFTDISKVDKQVMFVRDTKGSLRRASRRSLPEETKKPAFFM
ncbi:hypothetical protein BC830DRAFT_1171426 [Chytriomyces sp. MP71]|nr:hypothetical protein BC830DRAFT_1171426 [Chytriomyces sp. MP71]